MLNQAEIGMSCALGADAGMVGFLASRYAPPDVRELVMTKLASGEWAGKTAQLLTERTGGSDLAQIETTATPHGDAWLLNGFKWFASNCDGEAYVVLAKPEGAPDGIERHRVVPRAQQRRDGIAQRRPHPPAEGQARNESRRVRRGRVRRCRSVPDGSERRRGKRRTQPATGNRSRA